MKTVLSSNIFQLKFTHCVLNEIRFLEPNKKHREEKESIAGIPVRLPKKRMAVPTGASGLQLLDKIPAQYLLGSCFKSLLGVLKERMQVPLFIGMSDCGSKADTGILLGALGSKSQ